MSTKQHLVLEDRKQIESMLNENVNFTIHLHAKKPRKPLCTNDLRGFALSYVYFFDPDTALEYHLDAGVSGDDLLDQHFQQCAIDGCHLVRLHRLCHEGIQPCFDFRVFYFDRLQLIALCLIL